MTNNETYWTAMVKIHFLVNICLIIHRMNLFKGRCSMYVFRICVLYFDLTSSHSAFLSSISKYAASISTFAPCEHPPLNSPQDQRIVRTHIAPGTSQWQDQRSRTESNASASWPGKWYATAQNSSQRTTCQRITMFSRVAKLAQCHSL